MPKNKQKKSQRGKHEVRIAPTREFLGYTTTGVVFNYPAISQIAMAYATQNSAETIGELPAVSYMLRRLYGMVPTYCPKSNRPLWDMRLIDELMQRLSISRATH